jgi:tripartite-type tricarboxylate transporter receptor subunit TctC
MPLSRVYPFWVDFPCIAGIRIARSTVTFRIAADATKRREGCPMPHPVLCLRSSVSAISRLTALLLVVLLSSPAGAQMFAGKTVNVIIGFGAGGGYDLWGRTVARHIGRHLPGNPNVVPQNMEGAGSFRAANFIYNVAPKDGTAIALIARDAVLGPLIGTPGAQFDATKLSWLGTPAIETNVCIASATAPVKTVQDLLEKTLVVGETGPGTGARVYPKALNDILGMKFKVVGVYPSSADVFLAMERSEVQGICESLDSIKVRRPDWVSSGSVTVLFQGGAKPNPELKDVPFVLDLARNDADREAIDFLYVGQGIGRPFVAPPNLAPDRIKLLRDAFTATMQDSEFIAETQQRKLALDPESGEALEALIKKAYATPKAIIERVARLIR